MLIPTGCSVGELVQIILKAERGQETNVDHDDARQQSEGEPASSSDKVGTFVCTVYAWLVERREVSVGPDRRWNHLTLDTLLAIPEAPANSVLLPNHRAVQRLKQDTYSQKRKSSVKNPDPLPPVQPRIYVSDEDVVWRAIAGHARDPKRVPRLEWQALVVIAASRSEGILQPELVRLASQDKRSLPRRTDALARKGYIVKSTCIANGLRTSKLWLSRFAPPAVRTFSRGDEVGGGVGSGSGVDKFDLSVETLTRDLAPVPWCALWQGAVIDYQALVRTLVAIVKAYGVIRSVDLKRKLGCSLQPRLLKLVSTACRRIVAKGILRFIAAVLMDASKLYKDCVQFVRDPTEDEWTAILATGSRQQAVQLRQKTVKRPDEARSHHKRRSSFDPDGWADDYIGTSGFRGSSQYDEKWTPDKAVSNVLFECIQKSGRRGLNTRQLVNQIGLPAFTKYTSRFLRTVTQPGSQPPHQRQYELVREQQRVGRVLEYRFYTKTALAGLGDQTGEDAPGVIATTSLRAGSASEYGFPDISAEAPSELVGINYTQAILVHPSRRRGIKRKRTHRVSQKTAARPAGDASELKDASPKRGRGRPPKRRKIASPSNTTNVAEDAAEADQSTAGQPMESTATAMDSGGQQRAPTPETPKAPPRTPGAHLGARGDLYVGRCRGRPKKAVVVIFKLSPENARSLLPGLMDTTLEAGNAGNSETTGVGGTSGQASEQNPPEENAATSVLNETRATSPAQTDAVETAPLAEEVAPVDGPTVENEEEEPTNAWESFLWQRKRFSRKPGYRWRCSVCQGTWKNDLGLQYHITKARVPCNPNFAGQPRKGKQDSIQIIGLSKPSVVQRPSTSAITAARSAAVPRGAVPRSRRQRAESPRPAEERSGSLADGILPPSQSEKAQKEGVDPLPVQDTHKTSLGPSPVIESFAAAVPTKASTIAAEPVPPPHGASRLSREATPGTLQQADTAVSAAREKPSVSRTGESTAGSRHSATPAADTSRAEMVTGDDQSTVKKFEAGSSLKIERYKREDAEWQSVARSRETRRIVNYLINSNGGVFPGPPALDLAVRHVWSTTIDARIPPPDRRMIAKAVGYLLRSGQVKKVAHAFRRSDGRFSKAELLLLPETDPFGQSADQVKRAMKAALPDVYVPPAFRPADGFSGVDYPSVFKSRVKTGNQIRDVAILEAPVYVRRPGERPAVLDRVTPKRRRADSDSDIGDGRKRRKFKESFKHTTPAQLINSLIGYDVDDDEATDGSGWHSKAAKGPPTNWPRRGIELTFLKPNTSVFEEDDRLDENLEEASPPGTPQSATATNVDDGVRPETASTGNTTLSHGHGELAIAPIIVLGSRDVWPAFGVGYFQETDCSYTLGGIQPTLKWQLLQNLPRDISEVSPAFVTRFRPENYDDPYYGKFCHIVTAVGMWEQSPRGQALLTCATIAPEHYIFLNHTVHPSQMSMAASPRPDWSSAVQFTGEGYQYLSDGSRGDDDITMRRRKRPYRRRNRMDPESKPKEFLPMLRDYHQRELSSLSADRRHVLPNHFTLDLRSSRAGENLLLAGVIVVRTLLGGVDRVTDWGLLMRLFPRLSLSTIKRESSYMQKTKAVFAAQLASKFREAFLKAYADGELPTLNYDDPISYDWKSLTEWALRLATESGDVDLPRSRADFDATNDVEPLPGDGGHGGRRDWRDTYFAPLSSSHARIEALVSFPACTELRSRRRPDNPSDEMLLSSSVLGRGGTGTSDLDAAFVLCRSWIRALCCTPPRRYDASRVRDRFLQGLVPLCGGSRRHVDAVVRRAAADLNAAKVIKFATSFGTYHGGMDDTSRDDAAGSRTAEQPPADQGRDVKRLYEIHEYYCHVLHKNSTEKVFRDAGAFKKRLDAEFAKHRLTPSTAVRSATDDTIDPVLMAEDDARSAAVAFDPAYEGLTIPYAVKDGIMLAALNMQAHHRIELSQHDVPNIPLGFEPGNYVGRKFPKSYYYFGLKAKPVPTVEHDDKPRLGFRMPGVDDSRGYIFADGLPDFLRDGALLPPIPVSGAGLLCTTATAADGEDINGDRSLLEQYLPPWVDLFGLPSQTLWARSLAAVLRCLAARGAPDVGAIANMLRPALEERDVRLVVRWARNVGIVGRPDWALHLDDPRQQGDQDEDDDVLVVKEWWWLLLAQQLDGFTEDEGWPGQWARGGPGGPRSAGKKGKNRRNKGKDGRRGDGNAAAVGLERGADTAVGAEGKGKRPATESTTV